MYKIAIRSGEIELASECLEVVHRAASKDPSLLYACVLDAQEVGDKDMAIAALQLLLEKYQFNPPSTIHIPALLRCTIRLMITRLESKSASHIEPDTDYIVPQLCKLFEGGEMFLLHLKLLEAHKHPSCYTSSKSKHSTQLSNKVLRNYRARLVLQECV
jgi:hypothetical protein